MDATFTLAELARAVERVLAHAPIPADERVSPAPDERTLRWYQTTGLLDRPLRYDGRTAIYGLRHLLQAVAVKLLQAEGKALAQVQAGLAGATTEALEAAVAEAVGPEPLADVRARAPLSEPLADVRARAPLPEPPPPPSPTLVAAEVAPGVTVLIDTRVQPGADAVLARIRSLFPSGGPR